MHFLYFRMKFQFFSCTGESAIVEHSTHEHLPQLRTCIVPHYRRLYNTYPTLLSLGPNQKVTVSPLEEKKDFLIRYRG